MMQGPLDIGRFLDSSHFSSIFSQEEIEGSKERVTPAMAACLREKNTCLSQELCLHRFLMILRCLPCFHLHVFASKAVRDLPTPHPQSQDCNIHVCIFYIAQIYKYDIVDAKIWVLHILRARKSSLSLSHRLSDFLDEYEANVVVPSSTRGPF